ncbi:MAG: ATP/cobalamin adenosyltransferase [Caulobacteraceae bacterium]|nr:ATP/cobalamin adenosyltransferase [Caulobacteraceae bacterium]
MGHRLTRIVTRTGDSGTTGLGDGKRVSKDDPVIEVLGSVDELISWFGVVITASQSQAAAETLRLVQHDLFDLGAQLSVPGTALLSEAHLARVEAAFEAINAPLGALREFILPGGSQASAFAQVARTVCRRAERQLVGLLSGAPGGELLPHGALGLAYLNRLSDLLFVIARTENRAAGGEDIPWERGKSVGG